LLSGIRLAIENFLSVCGRTITAILGIGVGFAISSLSSFASGPVIASVDA
jgi:hypothetical protein